jgi:hypothetical protein
VLLDGKVAIGRAISEKTGSWYPDGQRWLVQGSLDLRKGVNTLRLESEPLMSHIDKLRLVPLAKTGLAEQFNRLAVLAKQVEEADRQSKPPIKVMAVDEGSVKNARIHKRGSHLRLGEEVPRRFLQVIAGKEQPPLPNDQSGRLQLAHWMTSAENPLTSRVMVNRIWRWHFGRGLVATTDNFGANGQRPTHPKLLDYLAGRLIRSGWSIKALHREIMLSNTYQMSSDYSQTPANRRDPNSIDPGNRLRWRTDRRRLEAEAIRDALLMVSGRLDQQLGNAPLSLKTYDLPTGVLEQNQIFYDTSNRRTVYLPVLRTNLYDFLTLFDFANPDLPTGHRQTTTLPTQALLLLNSPLVVDCAKQLAIQLKTEQRFNDDSARLRYAYISLFSRSPHENEEKLAFAFLENYERTLDHIPGAPQRRLAAWAALCQTLLVSNGFVYVD